MFELPTLKMFLICSYFVPISANFFVLTANFFVLTVAVTAVQRFYISTSGCCKMDKNLTTANYFSGSDCP